MKVFVDECVDWRLARDIVGHEVKTARQRGWSTIKNGELLHHSARSAKVDLAQAARFAQMQVEEFKALNPAYNYALVNASATMPLRLVSQIRAQSKPNTLRQQSLVTRP